MKASGFSRFAAAVRAAGAELQVLAGAALAIGALATWSRALAIFALGVALTADGLRKRRTE